MRRDKVRVAVGVASVLVVVGAGSIVVSARSAEKRTVSASAQPAPPVVPSARPFIVPDNQISRVNPSPDQTTKPAMLQQVVNGPQSQALAQKVQRLIGPGYTLKGGSDVVVDCGVAVRVGFEDSARSFIEVQEQCLTEPARLSALAGQDARLTVQPDGTAVAVSSDGPTVRVARTSPTGELVQVAVWGPPPTKPGRGGSAPLTAIQARQIMDQLG